MKSRLLLLAAFATALAAPLSANAHRAWITPSAATFSGDDPWVSFDAAISNTLFNADHVAMPLDNLTITAPDGAALTAQNVMRGRYRSTFDLQLTQNGTYRVANTQSGVGVRYQLGGENRFWRGAAADIANAIPAGATDVRVTENSNRIETFVTRGAPTPVQPQNSGLELLPLTHPSDLVVEEPGRFRLLVDGRPAANVEVTIAPGGARYRNDTGEIKVTTDANGAFSVQWPSAGLWWVNATVRDLPSTIAGATRNASYAGVLEVLP